MEPAKSVEIVTSGETHKEHSAHLEKYKESTHKICYLSKFTSLRPFSQIMKAKGTRHTLSARNVSLSSGQEQLETSNTSF